MRIRANGHCSTRVCHARTQFNRSTIAGVWPSPEYAACCQPQCRGNNYILIIFDSCRYDTLRGGEAANHLQTGSARAAMVLRVMDRSLALQSAVRPAAAPQPEAGVRVGLLQEGLSEVHRPARHRRNRLQVPHPQALLPGVSEGVAGLSHPRHGVAAGAESAHHPEPRVRHLPPDGQAQRHEGDDPRNAVPRGPAVVLPAERRRDPLSLRAARRTSRELAAHQRRSRRLQAPGR